MKNIDKQMENINKQMKNINKQMENIVESHIIVFQTRNFKFFFPIG